jgi:ABC-type Fe3+ transport system substrate-binding protein
LLKDAPHPHAARTLANFSLSQEAQQIEAEEPGGGFIRLDVKPRVPELAFHPNAKPFPGTPEQRHRAYARGARHVRTAGCEGRD